MDEKRSWQKQISSSDLGGPRVGICTTFQRHHPKAASDAAYLAQEKHKLRSEHHTQLGQVVNSSDSLSGRQQAHLEEALLS